jgi:hypothetical protein
MASSNEDDHASLTTPILHNSTWRKAAALSENGRNPTSIQEARNTSLGNDDESIGLVVKDGGKLGKKKEKKQDTASWLFSMLRASNAPNLVHEVEEPPDWYSYLQELRMARKYQQYIAIFLFVLQAVTLLVVNHGFSSKQLVKHTLTSPSAGSLEGNWVSHLDESTAYYIAMNTLTGMLVCGYFFEILTVMFFSAWPDKDNWFNLLGFFYQNSDHQLVRSRLRGVNLGFQVRNIYRLIVLIFAMNMALSCGFACGGSKQHTSLLGSFSQSNQWLSFSMFTSIRLMDLMIVLPYAEEFWQGIFRSCKQIAIAFIPLLIFLWFFAVMGQILFGMDPFIYPYEGAKIHFTHEFPNPVPGGKSVSTNQTKLIKDFPQSTSTAGLEFSQDWFSTGPKSFVTMYQLYTQDGWASDVVRPAMKLADANTDDAYLNSLTVFILFFVYLFLAGVVITNFFTGIVVNAVESNAAQAQKEVSKGDKKDSDSDDDSDDDDEQHRQAELVFHAQVNAEMETVNREVSTVQEDVLLARAEVAEIRTSFLQELSNMREAQVQTQKLITQLLEKSQPKPE